MGPAFGQRRVPDRKLEKFSDSGDQVAQKFRAWRKHFENVAEINEWNDLRQRHEAMASMMYPASEAVANVDWRNTTINLLLDAFQFRFAPPGAGDIAKVEFEMAKQRAEETVLAWYTRAMSLYGRAWPERDVTTSVELSEKFARGLFNRRVQEYVWDQRPVGIDAAYLVANAKVAVAFKQAVIYGTSVAHLAGDGLELAKSGALVGDKGAGKDKKKSINNLDKRFSNQDKKARVPKTAEEKAKMRCYNCDQLGHLANECKQPKRPRKNFKVKKIGSIRTVEEDSEDEEEEQVGSGN